MAPFIESWPPEPGILLRCLLWRIIRFVNGRNSVRCGGKKVQSKNPPQALNRAIRNRQPFWLCLILVVAGATDAISLSGTEHTLCHAIANCLHTLILSLQEPVWAARSRTIAANKMFIPRGRLPALSFTFKKEKFALPMKRKIIAQRLPPSWAKATFLGHNVS